MPLPVLKYNPAATPADLVRLFHQSQLEWSRHLGEETELDFGRWISNPALAATAEANCLLDAYLTPQITAAHLIQQMNDVSNQTWRCCTLNPSMPGPTADLVDTLTAKGWMPSPWDILYRQKILMARSAVRNDLTIIPARAGYRLYEQLMEQRAAVENGTETEAATLHLDDYHFDVLLALQSGQPVGSIGVLGSGETGTVREWYVSPTARLTGIGSILLDRAMEICARGVLKHIMIGVPQSAVTASQLCKKVGFDVIGQWTAWNRPQD